jgi:LysM repeat protein
MIIAMKKKKAVEQKETLSKEPKKGIVIAETEEDVALGTNIGDPDDFKNEVKKEAEKGRFVRTIMPILVFLLIGAIIAYGTMYYKNQSEKETPKKAEEKIQTPPATDGSSTSDDPATVDANTDTTTDTTVTPDTPVSSDTTTSYTVYVVKSGDTLSGIANANDMTSTALAKYNGIADAESLQIGQKIKIPN